jgi:DNA polymerase III delta prime subunit
VTTNKSCSTEQSSDCYFRNWQYTELQLSSKRKCFVAYASAISGAGDAIETAINEIKDGGIVSIRSWRSLPIAGNVVIEIICEEIRNCDLFIADVTLLNANVLFELGYAIAQQKLIYILYNPSFERASIDFEQFQTLTTLGYVRYSNSAEIVHAFYRDQPYEEGRELLIDQLKRSGNDQGTIDHLLYIKPEIPTEPATRVARRVTSGQIPSLIDDPEDIRFQSASWYASAVANAYAVVCHFLSQEHKGSKLNNARNAFVAGLAYGFKKPLLILAHDPYVSPIDYHDLLRTHKDAGEAVSIFDDWALFWVRQYAESQKQREQYREERKKHAALLDIYLGEPVAEHESKRLEEYFVETSSYRESLNANYSIFVGRRGTGKTATLYKLSSELASDPRNHVCAIMPAGFELAGIANLFRNEAKDSPHRGYLLESFWKFLVYTELAKSVYENILSRPTYSSRTAEENVLCEFVAIHQSIVMPEFGTRLETVVASLEKVSDQYPNNREKITESLHEVMLGNLRRILGNALAEKNKVAILIDNLDKSWTPSSDIDLTGELLLGLMQVGIKISEEFHRSGSGRHAVDMKMIVFMRSDIFGMISRVAKERDKLPARYINWNDPELLLRVIEERFLKAGVEVVSRDEIWERFFPIKIGVTPVRDFLVRAVFPRPRDLIVLVKACIESAVNRGHAKVAEQDVSAGCSQYASYAFNAIVVEGAPQVEHLEDLLFSFIDGPAIVNEYRLLEVMEQFNPNYDIELFIKILSELTFLGLEVSFNKFEFVYDPGQETLISQRAKRTAAVYGERRFKIHAAFHELLGLKTLSSPDQKELSL